VGAAARLRGLAWVATAPAISVFLAATSAILAHAVGLDWNIWPLLGLTVVVAFLTWITQRMLYRSPAKHDLALEQSPTYSSGATTPPKQVHSAWWIISSIAVAGALATRQLIRVLGSPKAFSQTYDNIFHMNAIRWILDTRNASSLDMLMTSGDGSASYYPMAWHDLASLTLITLHSDHITYAVNALIWVMMALVWPMGCIFLSQAMLRRGGPLNMGAAVLSVSFTAFPMLLILFGVLYPNFLSLCLVPAVLGLAVAALRLGNGNPVSWPSAVIAGVMAIGGITLAHPSGLISFFAMMLIPLLVTWTLRATPLLQRRPLRTRESPFPTFPWRVVLTLVAAVSTALMFWKLRPPKEAMVWGPVGTTSLALGQALTMSPLESGVVPLIGVLLAVGIYAILRTRRHLWLLLATVTVFVFWGQAVRLPRGVVRNAWLGVWYDDPFRVGALLPIVGFPLAILGLSHVLEFIDSHVEVHLPRKVTALPALLLAVFLTGATQWSAGMDHAIETAAASYRITPDAPLVNTDELKVIEAVPSLVPPDQVIAVNPWNGSSMVYALTGHPTTATHVSYKPNADQQELIDHLRQASASPNVCRALRELNVHWVLDFGKQEIIGAHVIYPGFENLGMAPGFQVAYRSGDKVLYHITACGLG
jgi:hypothetical protein